MSHTFAHCTIADHIDILVYLIQKNHTPSQHSTSVSQISDTSIRGEHIIRGIIERSQRYPESLQLFRKLVGITHTKDFFAYFKNTQSHYPQTV